MGGADVTEYCDLDLWMGTGLLGAQCRVWWQLVTVAR